MEEHCPKYNVCVPSQQLSQRKEKNFSRSSHNSNRCNKTPTPEPNIETVMKGHNAIEKLKTIKKGDEIKRNGITWYWNLEKRKGVCIYVRRDPCCTSNCGGETNKVCSGL